MTGRELIDAIQAHPDWLELPVWLITLDKDEDFVGLTSVEKDCYEVEGPLVIALISDPKAADKTVTETDCG